MEMQLIEISSRKFRLVRKSQNVEMFFLETEF